VFSNAFHSKALQESIELVAFHPNLFAWSGGRKDGLVQVTAPSAEDSVFAGEYVRRAFQHVLGLSLSAYQN